MKIKFLQIFFIFLLVLPSANATILDVTIDGGDAIWLAGRTDLTIPDASLPWTGGMIRHGGPTPEEIQETFPPEFTVAAGDIIRVLDPASGGISFFNGFGAPIFGPDGNGVDGSNLFSFGDISGYIGPQGPLVGLFLNDSIPNGSSPPTTLNFSNSGIGTDFSMLDPGLNQIFYIGNGVNSINELQQFIAPMGATRLFLGIPDGFGFVGSPGAYDDNDGAYRIKLGIKEIPAIPEPGTMILLCFGFLGLAGVSRRKQ